MLLSLAVGALLVAAPDTMVVPLHEVVVTGTRIADTTLRVPAAVSVVDARRISDTRGVSLKDALLTVPGVFSQSRGGAQDVRITIRGFGARGNGERSNAGNMRGIRIVTDGIPITEPDGRTSLDLVDLGAAGRIEVSRSNASTLNGNAAGGVIHLRTPLDFERPFVEVRQRAGSFGYHREQVLTGFAIGSARAQFSLANSTFDGWRQHSQSAGTQAELRLAAPFGEHSRFGLLLDGVSNINRFPGALTASEAATDPTGADPGYVARDERRRNRVGRAGVTLDHALTSTQDLAFTGFVEPKALQRSERGRFRDFTRIHTGGSAGWRGRFTPAAGTELSLSAGGDDAFQDGAILFYNLNPDGSRNTTVRANKREGANSGGLYAQADARFAGRWRASLAGRWDALWYISEDFIDPTLDATKTFKRLTPKASVSYLLDHHTAYASFGGGVEAPAFNEIDPPPPYDVLTGLNPFLDPMISTTYEAGMKGEWADLGRAGAVRYDAALYWIEVENDLIAFDGGAYFKTIGQSRRRGAELAVHWSPITRATLWGSLTLSDNEYVEYLGDPALGNGGDLSGRNIPGLPEKLFQGGIRVGPWQGLEAAVETQAVDGYFADDANRFAIQNHAVLGARLAWEGTAGYRLRAFVAGDNLTDADFAESVFINPVPNPDPSRVRYVEPGLPRSWSAGLTFRFQ